MASMGNPVVGGLSRQILDALMKRGAGPSTSGGPTGAAPEMASGALSSQLSQLQSADPGAVHKKLMAMKQDTVDLLPQIAFSLPGVSKHLASLLKALDGAIKESEQAASTQKSVEASPVSMSAANLGGNPAGGAPQPGGGNPFIPGAGI